MTWSRSHSAVDRCAGGRGGWLSQSEGAPDWRCPLESSTAGSPTGWVSPGPQPRELRAHTLLCPQNVLGAAAGQGRPGLCWSSLFRGRSQKAAQGIREEQKWPSRIVTVNILEAQVTYRLVPSGECAARWVLTKKAMWVILLSVGSKPGRYDGNLKNSKG